MAGNIILSGISIFLRSVKNKAARTVIKNILKIRSIRKIVQCPMSNVNCILEKLCQNKNPINIPTTISIRGYSQEIFLWQYLHFPPVEMKDRIGKRSYQRRVFLHCTQYDLPQNDCLTKLLSARTFIKLPNTVPSKNPADAQTIILISTTSS